MNTVYKYFYPMLAILVAIIFLLIAYTLIQDQSNKNSSDNQDIENNYEIETESGSTEEFTMEDVENANNIYNYCLTVVEENVYELTEAWARQHEGGFEQISSLCGIDGTFAFNQEHSASSEAKNELNKFFVGVLVQEENDLSNNTLDEGIPSIADLNAAKRDTTRRQFLNEIALWVDSFYVQNNRYPASSEINFTTELGIQFTGDVPATTILNYDDPFLSASEASSSTGTSYCYESINSVLFRLAVKMENGNTIQTGNDTIDCENF